MTPLTAFGERFEPARFELDWTSVELDRTLAAFEGDKIVGTGRLYSLELTMPGGRLLPTAGVSWIGVLPTHRRRGILTAIKRTQLDDAVERGSRSRSCTRRRVASTAGSATACRRAR